MSLTEISVRIAIVTMLALVALIAIGWRRPASDYPRRVPSRDAAAHGRRHDEHSPPHATTGIHDTGRIAARKILDVLGLGSIAAFIGIIIALVVSTAIAVMVTALLDRL